VLTGLGRLRAQGLDTELRGLAVWDPDGGGARGGVASVVSVWQQGRVPFDHVNPSQLRSSVGAPGGATRPAMSPRPPASAGIAETEPEVARYEIKSMLFADAVGYGQLAEDQIPAYVTGFLGSVAALNRRTRHRFEHVETAGDTLYMVFDSAGDAALYALELSELVHAASWADVGLPPGFSLRIALHCGPVYCGTDPVTGSAIYTGPHASRAARIEPIAPPGQVYASAAFAAVAAASAADGFSLRYVGNIPLAGRSGSMPLYHLQRET
jgi:class 3 adenylate cyclase